MPTYSSLTPRICVLLLILLSFGSCRTKHESKVDVRLSYTPPDSFIQDLPTPFEELSPVERRQDWGRELRIGTGFGKEPDLYRAITAFKRALILTPTSAVSRRLQLEFNIAISYYLGGKYRPVIDTFENSGLMNVTKAFPPFETLLIILYDSYHKVDDEEKALKVMNLLETYFPETANNLKLSTALSEGEVQEAKTLAALHPSSTFLTETIDHYQHNTKQVQTAGLLNAALPGAGYLYVGQKRSAVTSFLLNALFIWATVHFFDHGHTAAGIITLGFEFGWYFGGIHGASNAAKRYNERLFEQHGHNMLFQEKLFPALMVKHAF